MTDSLASVPNHVACVMDGNGRWAALKGLPRTAGHQAGEQALFSIVEASIEAGVEWLTVYAFSTENWARPAEEVEFLMQFNEEVIDRQAEELDKQGVRLLFAGRHGYPVPETLAARMQQAEQLTSGNTRLTLTVAFNYGGRAEIVDAVRRLVQRGMSLDTLDEDAISKALYIDGMPDVDLLIRTSNEFRISNFLLWQVAYAELYFTETLWPDFDGVAFRLALEEYNNRNRRFGGLDADSPAEASTQA